MGAKRPDFIKLDPYALNKLATDYSERQYASSAANAVSPLLAQGTRFETDEAANRLAGVPDPQVAGALGAAGFSDVNLPGDPFAEARSLGRSSTPQAIQSIDVRARNHFANLFANNKKKPVGIGLEDIGNIAVNNSGGQAAFQQGLANATADAKNAASVNEFNNINGILGAIGTTARGIGSVASGGLGSAVSPYLSSFFYGNGNGTSYNNSFSPYTWNSPVSGLSFPDLYTPSGAPAPPSGP